MMKISATGGKARTEDQLAWAEQRLQGLGFTVSTVNNIKSYVREHEGLVVYADPRRDGEISFRIFKKPPPKHRSPLDQFVLPDRRKYGLLAKYENKIASIAMPRGR